MVDMALTRQWLIIMAIKVLSISRHRHKRQEIVESPHVVPIPGQHPVIADTALLVIRHLAISVTVGLTIGSE